MTNERITDLVKPFRVQLVHDDQGGVIGANIRALGGELDYETVREATRSLVDHFRSQELRKRHRLRNTSTLQALRKAREAGGGVTDVYLATVATAYGELVGTDAPIAETLASAMPGTSLSAVRSHLQRARKEGFLTPTRQGKEEGEPTQKARDVLAGLIENPEV